MCYRTFTGARFPETKNIKHKNSTVFRSAMKKLFVLLLFLFLLGCTSQETVLIKTTAAEIPISVEIADEIDEQTIGLMYRTELAADSGMLFVFSEEKQHVFWMKNTKIPLDIIFFDESRTIVDIKENFEPCIVDACEKYYSKPAMYALEVNAGFTAEQGIVVGDSLLFE